MRPDPVRDAGKDGIPSADASHALSSYCGVDAWVRYPQPDVPGGPPDRPYRFYQVAGESTGWGRVDELPSADAERASRF